MRTPNDQYVQVGPIKTRFWAVGDSGTNVILIHGLGRFVEDWRCNIHELAQQHRVYALDMVGSGRSEKSPVTFSLPYLAQFVQAFMGALDIKHASLVGHSLGGSIALQCAIQFPDQVQGLVLLNSAGLGKELPLGLRLSSLPLLGRWLTRPDRQGIANSLKKGFYDPALVSDEWVQLCYQYATLPGAQASLLAQIRAFIDLSGMRDAVICPLVDTLGGVTQPTLIVWGQQDRTLPAAHAHIAHKNIANAQLEIFDSCGHFVQIERAAEFNALVLKFLATVTT